MTEIEARQWLAARDVPHGTIDRITAFLDLLTEEAKLQNLVAQSTMTALWSRHIVDSAQLLDLVAPWQTWVDLGTGAGFPGMVIALLTDRPVTLIEVRAKRVDYLRRIKQALALDHVTIIGKRVEAAAGMFDVISARALAPLPELLALAAPLAGPQTQWVLPKGRQAQVELEAARASWHGSFTLVPSITDAESAIIVARDVRPRRSGR